MAGLWKRLSLAIGIIGLTSLAWIGGGYGSRLLQEYERESKVQSLTEYLLNQMGTMTIGDTLRMFPLTYLDGTPADLEAIIIGNTLIMIAHPSCGACAGEVQGLNDLIESGVNSAQVVIIIDGEMYDVSHFMDDHKPQATVLHDAHSHYVSQYKISDTPFNLFVDDHLVIRDIVASAPSVGKIGNWVGE
jgi:hypothetical protein